MSNNYKVLYNVEQNAPKIILDVVELLPQNDSLNNIIKYCKNLKLIARLYDNNDKNLGYVKDNGECKI